MKVLITALVLILSQAATANTCFNSDRIRNWNYNNATKVLTLTDRTASYEVKTLSLCHELAWGVQLGFKAFSTTRVCRGDQIVVLDAWQRPLQTCRIHSITAK